MQEILKDWDNAAQFLNQRINELSSRITKLESIIGEDILVDVSTAPEYSGNQPTYPTPEIATLSLEESEDVVEEAETETVPEVSEETEAEA